MVADENEKSYVHVQPVASTRVIVTFRCSYGAFLRRFSAGKGGRRSS